MSNASESLIFRELSNVFEGYTTPPPDVDMTLPSFLWPDINIGQAFKVEGDTYVVHRIQLMGHANEDPVMNVGFYKDETNGKTD